MSRRGARSIFIRDVALTVLRDGQWHGTSEIVEACGMTKTPEGRELVTTQLRQLGWDGVLERTVACGHIEGRYHLLEPPGSDEAFEDLVSRLGDLSTSEWPHPHPHPPRSVALRAT